MLPEALQDIGFSNGHINVKLNVMLWSKQADLSLCHLQSIEHGNVRIALNEYLLP
jgi:hypothetical protein